MEMKWGKLADRLAGVGVKRLSDADTRVSRSNQHEVGTTKKMREDFLGDDQRRNFSTNYFWLGETRECMHDASATHYNTRFNQPHRSPEWRLYYTSNPVTESMRSGDSLFLAKKNTGSLLFIVAPSGSTSEQQLYWLFGLKPEDDNFVSCKFTDTGIELDFSAREILAELGIEFDELEPHKLDSIIEQFGYEFPATAIFSRVARESLPEINAGDDPDMALSAWLAREKSLFRRLESRIINKMLDDDILTVDGVDVDKLIDYSLSVHNRRKSRMGYSLEHHISAVLDAHDLTYVRGATTEHNHKPDFLFPSLEAYQTADAGDHNLTFLGAKSTCKDRWRQVLAEADKIKQKHLLTTQSGMSESQTNQMRVYNLQLVVPKSFQSSYTPAQKTWLWSVNDFIKEVKQRSTR